MPFLYEKSISISACNSKMNRRFDFLANRHYRPASPFNLFFSSLTIETTGKLERSESQNAWKAGTIKKARTTMKAGTTGIFQNTLISRYYPPKNLKSMQKKVK
jgi:hypothetical protein